jgi:hypothetical protein
MPDRSHGAGGISRRNADLKFAIETLGFDSAAGVVLSNAASVPCDAAAHGLVLMIEFVRALAKRQARLDAASVTSNENGKRTLH